ncbi:hypothetical protein Tco_0492231 [Tanacetum coccineum]
MSFSKRSGTDAACYSKPLDSLKKWNDHFFWVDTFACPASFSWNTSKSVSKDPFPKSFEFNTKHYATLVAYPVPFHNFCVKMARMDLLSFIRIADPTKVRVGERQRAKDEPKLLDTTVGRVVLLLPVAPAHGQGNSTSGNQGAGIQYVSEVAEVVAEDVAPLQPRHKKKRKTVVVDVGEPSHPAKKLRDDHGTPGGPTIGGVARQMSLSAKVRIRIEFNIREKRRLSVVEAKAAEAIRLRAKVSQFENFVDQLEKFQDEKIKEVNEKFDKLSADFVEMALHLEEKFYPHLLTTISGRRWLLTNGMELAIAKCLNSNEYLSVLGAEIGKAIKKGMQEGLSAGITQGAEGRKLANVAAYNSSAEADYLSALQRLQSVNFSLIAELRANKDASVDTIMNLLRLEDTLAERLSLTESQPHVSQLMVPIHHSPDQRVIGASALSLSLDVSSSRVWKIKENIARHVSALRGVFIPLAEPLSVVALEDDYEVVHADGQESTGADGQTIVGANVNPFPNIDDAELNVLE